MGGCKKHAHQDFQYECMRSLYWQTLKINDENYVLVKDNKLFDGSYVVYQNQMIHIELLPSLELDHAYLIPQIHKDTFKKNYKIWFILAYLKNVVTLNGHHHVSSYKKDSCVGQISDLH